IVSYDYPRLEVEVSCGKGTYIRALARDLGERLSCGGLIETLRRTRVGPFRAEESVPWDADTATVRARLLPLAAAVRDLPQLTLSAEEVNRLRHGQSVPLAGIGVADEEKETAIFDASGRLAAVARVRRAPQELRPEKIFLPDP